MEDIPPRACMPCSSTRRCCTPRRAKRCCTTSCTTSAAAPATGRWTSFVESNVKALREQIGDRQSAVRPVGRRGLVGAGGHAGQGGGQAADLRLCGPRPAAEERDGGGMRGLWTRATPTSTSTLCLRGCPGPLLQQAGRRHRAGAQAQDHRRGVHPGLRGGGQEDRPCGLPGTGHHLPRRGGERPGRRVHRDQEPPQRGRPAGPRGLQGSGGAPAQPVQGRGASGRARAGPARVPGQPPALPGSRAWPSGSSAR